MALWPAELVAWATTSPCECPQRSAVGSCPRPSPFLESWCWSPRVGGRICWCRRCPPTIWKTREILSSVRWTDAETMCQSPSLHVCGTGARSWWVALLDRAQEGRGGARRTRTPPRTGRRTQGHLPRIRLGAGEDPGPVVPGHTQLQAHPVQAIGCPAQKTASVRRGAFCVRDGVGCPLVWGSHGLWRTSGVDAGADTGAAVAVTHTHHSGATGAEGGGQPAQAPGAAVDMGGGGGRWVPQGRLRKRSGA